MPGFPIDGNIYHYWETMLGISLMIIISSTGYWYHMVGNQLTMSTNHRYVRNAKTQAGKYNGFPGFPDMGDCSTNLILGILGNNEFTISFPTLKLRNFFSHGMANLEDWGSAAELPVFSTMSLTLILQSHNVSRYVTLLNLLWPHTMGISLEGHSQMWFSAYAPSSDRLNNQKSFKSLQSPLYSLNLCCLFQTLAAEDPRKKVGGFSKTRSE